MLLVKIIAGILLVFTTFAAFVSYCGDYNDFCKKRFGAGPLDPVWFAAAGLAVFVLRQGLLYYADAAVHHLDLTDEIVLTALGGGGVALTYVLCILATNLVHGLLTATLLLVIGTIFSPLLVICIVLAPFGLFSGERRYVEIRRHRFWHN